MNEKTIIQLEKTTVVRLKAIGKKGESYDALINRILDESTAGGNDGGKPD